MIKGIKFDNLKLLCNQNRNENNHPVKFICDLLIKGLSYQNKSYLQILMNCLFDVHLIKDDLKKKTHIKICINNVYM
jgi:hypothetical protein